MSTITCMDEIKRNGYLAGFSCSLMSGVFILVALDFGFNLSGKVLTLFGVMFGILGIGSLWKPESIGPIATQLLENMRRNAEEQNKPQKKEVKIINQTINNSGNMSNTIGSKNKIKTVSNKGDES